MWWIRQSSTDTRHAGYEHVACIASIAASYSSHHSSALKPSAAAIRSSSPRSARAEAGRRVSEVFGNLRGHLDLVFSEPDPAVLLQQEPIDRSGIVGVPLSPQVAVHMALAHRRGRTISRANQAFLDWAESKL